MTLNSSLRVRREYQSKAGKKKKKKREGTRKEEVIKSGALARFPLEGEVWPGCAGAAGGPAALPAEPAPGWPGARQSDASAGLPALGEAAQPPHTMALSRAKQRRRNPRCFLCSEPRHRVSALQPLADALGSARSPAPLYKCLKPPLSWDLQTLHAVMHCIFRLFCHDRQDRESRRERE